MSKKFTALPVFVTPLASGLWSTQNQRSAELTPRYIQRYVGPRLNSIHSTHSYPEITYCLAGSGTIIADSRISLRPHRAVLIGAGVKHYEQADGDMETIWIGLQGTLVDDLMDYTILTLDEPTNTPILERLWEISQRFSTGSGIVCDALTRLLYARMLSGVHTGAAMDFVSRVLTIIHEQLSQPITVAQLAARLDCSEGHLHRTFKSSTGETPVQCITRLRMERAIQLMRQTRLSLKQIALRVGYRDPLYFSRIFHKYHGRSAREIARSLRK